MPLTPRAFTVRLCFNFVAVKIIHPLHGCNAIIPERVKRNSNILTWVYRSQQKIPWGANRKYHVDTLWMLPIDWRLAGSNVTNGTFLKTWGPWDGLYAVSSLIQVFMYSYSVAKDKGLFGICLDNCWNKLRFSQTIAPSLNFLVCKPLMEEKPT